jgi:preprotein translocase subunit SecA
MSIVDTVLHKVFGTPHERKVKQLRPIIEKIHAARLALEALDDAALAAKSAEFREKLKNGATLDDIKVDAFAVCQEACDRRLGIFNIFKPEYGFDFSRLGPELQDAVNDAKAGAAEILFEYEADRCAILYGAGLYGSGAESYRLLFIFRDGTSQTVHEGKVTAIRVNAAGSVLYYNTTAPDGREIQHGVNFD